METEAVRASILRWSILRHPTLPQRTAQSENSDGINLPESGGEPVGVAMLDQLTQVSMLVADFKKAINFYSYVLGLPVITKSDKSAEFRTEGVVLAVKPRGGAGGTGTTQITFQVADLEVVFNDAKRRGAKVLVPPRTVDGGRLAQLADPDGNVIELFEPEA